MSARLERSGVFALALLGITLAAIGIRVLALEAGGTLLATGDEDYYFQTAVEIAREGRHLYPPRGALAEWPPGYPYFLSLFVPGGSEVSAEAIVARLVAAQIGLGGLLVALCGALGRAWFGAREGLVAASLAALYPNFVVFSHYLFSETLFSALILVALLGVVRFEERPTAGVLVLSGVALGLATLTRELALPVAGVCAAWWVFRASPGARPRAVGHAIALLAVIPAIVVPWTLRNDRVLGSPVLVSNAGWLNLRSGNSLSEADWMRPAGSELEAFRRTYFAIPDEMERADYARSQALVLIGEEQPAWIFKKAVRTAALLASPDSYLFKKISRGAYPELGPDAIRVLLVVVPASTLVLLLLALPAWAADRRRGRRELVATLALAVFAIHLLANASVRYRLPWMPLAVLYAASMLSDPRRVLASIGTRSRAGVAVLGLLLLLTGVPYFWPDAVSLFETGRYREAMRP
ncbi:MAG: glycosyltransferase family 39 protein [Myxococcota bacterium]